MPSTGLLATAAARVLEQGRDVAQRPSALRQLLDLAFPFSFYEQAPFLGQGISAVTLTSAGDRPPSPVGDTPGQLKIHAARFGHIGRASQQLLASLDEGLELAQGTSSYVYFGARIVRGWAIEIVLVAALLPFLTAVVDLFALTRRRRMQLMPAVLSMRSRVLFWLVRPGRLRARRARRLVAARVASAARTRIEQRHGLAPLRPDRPRRVVVPRLARHP